MPWGTQSQSTIRQPDKSGGRIAGAEASTAEVDGNWQEVAAELEFRFGGLPGQGDALAGVAAANSLAAQSTFFGAQGPDTTSTATAPSVATPATTVQASGATVVRAFWWGFHVEIGHEDLETVLNSADAINSLVALIGGNIPSPAAPWIKLLAPFVASIHQRLRELDRGRGIYISMSWFAPGVFIPTPV